jgi:hypothetical protein
MYLIFLTLSILGTILLSKIDKSLSTEINSGEFFKIDCNSDIWIDSFTKRKKIYKILLFISLIPVVNVITTIVIFAIILYWYIDKFIFSKLF